MRVLGAAGTAVGTWVARFVQRRIVGSGQRPPRPARNGPGPGPVPGVPPSKKASSAVAASSTTISVPRKVTTSPPTTAETPTARVPCLHDGDTVIWDSLAIIEYLDEKFPTTPLMPSSLEGKARVRQ